MNTAVVADDDDDDDFDNNGDDVLDNDDDNKTYHASTKRKIHFKTGPTYSFFLISRIQNFHKLSDIVAGL